MNQSFYTKEGLDYLYFARPGTAYGSQAFGAGSSLGGTIGMDTKQGFFEKGTKKLKPIEMIKPQTLKQAPLITQLWFERAEKVMN